MLATWRELVPTIEAVYEYSGVGGNLHVVLDDGNIRDDDIRFCQARIAEEPDETKRDVEARCAELLLRASRTQRLKAVRGWYGGLPHP